MLERESHVNPGEIIQRNARLFGVTTQEILERGGKLPVRIARNQACREMRNEGMSYPSIGQALDGRDHTTIISNVKTDIPDILPAVEVPVVVEEYLNKNFQGIKPNDITSSARVAHISVPRQALIRHLFYDKGVTIGQISELLKKHSSSVTTSINKPHEKVRDEIEKWKVNDLAKKTALIKAREAEQRRLEKEKTKIKQEVFTDVTLQQVAEEYAVTREEMVSKSRKKTFVQPRKTAQFILHKGTDFSFKKIANVVGSSDHTSAIHAIGTVERRLDFDPDFGERLKDLFARINDITIKRVQELTA